MPATTITFESTKKTKWFPTILFLIWTIACCIELGLIGYDIISNSELKGILILEWIALLGGALLGINYLSWQIRGKELLIFTDKFIELKKHGVFFKRILKIDYAEVDNIKYDEAYNVPRWMQVYGIGGGRIQIHYLGRYRRFGQDLTTSEAEILTDEIKRQFDDRKKLLENNSQRFDLN